jgi:hypothetical protein
MLDYRSRPVKMRFLSVQRGTVSSLSGTERILNEALGLKETVYIYIYIYIYIYNGERNFPKVK